MDIGSTLAMLANELIINAIKHGGPAEDGKLQIVAELSRIEGWLHLRFWNSGDPVAMD